MTRDGITVAITGQALIHGPLDLSVAGAETEMAQLAAALDIVAERDKSLESCAERAGDLLARLRGWRDTRTAGGGKAVNAADDEVDDGATDLVRWAEAYTQSLVLHASPLHIGPIFRRQLQGRPRAWIFTSATLSMGGNFKHFASRLGLGGEGFLSFSIATPTGEGVTTPMTFTRSRRCVMVENLNLY